VTTIPDGYTTITPYIAYDSAAEAIDFYIKTLDAKEVMRLPTPDGGVGHAEIQIGNARIMLSDTNPKSGMKSAKELGGSPVSFFVYFKDVETAFTKAKENGMTEVSPLEDMFWGDRMGQLVDPYGLVWSLAQHIRDVSPEEIAEAMKNMASQE